MKNTMSNYTVSLGRKQDTLTYPNLQCNCIVKVYEVACWRSEVFWQLREMCECSIMKIKLHMPVIGKMSNVLSSIILKSGEITFNTIQAHNTLYNLWTFWEWNKQHGMKKLQCIHRIRTVSKAWITEVHSMYTVWNNHKAKSWSILKGNRTKLKRAAHVRVRPNANLHNVWM